MERKESDLNEIKALAKIFVYTEITKTEFSPAIIIHPIFESGIQYFKIDNEIKMIDITDDEEGLRKIQEKICDKIDKSKTVYDIYIIIRKSYKLTFIKYAYEHLSIKDMSMLLADAWVTSEDPNQDVNVPLRTIVKWFKKCDKTTLMDEQEYQIYKDFSEFLTVYRGVGINRNPHGLSWTTDYDKAKWFAHRFDTHQKQGYLLKADIIKGDILAYFDTRNESEVVVNVFNLKERYINNGKNGGN